MSRFTLSLFACSCVVALGCEEGPPVQPPSPLIEQLVGTWRGHHLDETNDISESIELVLVQLSENEAEVTVNFGPRGRGPDPAPETFRLAFDGRTMTFVDFSPFLGDVSVSVHADGTLDGITTGLGFRIEGDGALDPDAGRLELFTFATRSGFVWSGRMVLCREGATGCESTTSIPLPASCEIVPEVPNASMSCGDECAHPNGACVGGVCLQVCIPGECEDRCAGNETCVRAEFEGSAVTFADGRPFGGCTIDDGGRGRAYETCGGRMGGCEAGLRCLALGASSEGVCAAPCESNTHCEPGSRGESIGCDLYEDSTNRRFCALRCVPTSDGATGDAECPSDLGCLPAPSGGNCLPRPDE